MRARRSRGTRLLEERLQELRELSSQRERELDLLAYELAEIDALAPDEREHEQLLAARERLRRLDALCTAAGAGAEALSPESGEANGAVQLPRGAGGLDALAGVDPLLDALAERMRALADRVRGPGRRAARATASGRRGSDASEGTEPNSLDALERRLDAIERLARKHGGSDRGGARVRRRCPRAPRAARRGGGCARADHRAVGDARAELQRHVLSLRSARAAAAQASRSAVREQLRSLAMGEASFEVVLEEREPGPRAVTRSSS